MKHVRITDPILLRRLIGVHIACWALYIAYELLTLYAGGARLEHFHIYALYYALNISYFYLNAALLSRSLKVKHIQKWQALVAILILFAAFLFTKAIADYLLYRSPLHLNLTTLLAGVKGDLFRCGYFALLSLFYSLILHLGHIRERTLTIENKFLSAEKEKLSLNADLAESRMAFLS